VDAATPRKGWVYGLNIGWGWLRASADDDGGGARRDSDWADDFSGGLRAGQAIGDRTIVGLEVAGWSDDAEPYGVDAFWILATGTWFPVETAGWYLKAGAGVGSLNLSQETGVVDGFAQTVTGFGLDLGLGHELMVSDTMALSAVYDLRWMTGGEIGYLENVSLLSHQITLGLTWYVGR
jgi:hypothetical protein